MRLHYKFLHHLYVLGTLSHHFCFLDNHVVLFEILRRLFVSSLPMFIKIVEFIDNVYVIGQSYAILGKF